jgi:thiosulfate dehydrogenase [quinone] large subunit
MEDMALAVIIWLCTLPLVGLLVIPFFGLKVGLIVAAALILGIFIWFSAFIGGFMNWNFMMAGSASVNPVFLILSILLVLAWKTAGWIGLDRWLLVQVGTPWQPGLVFQKK